MSKSEGLGFGGHLLIGLVIFQVTGLILRESETFAFLPEWSFFLPAYLFGGLLLLASFGQLTDLFILAHQCTATRAGLVFASGVVAAACVMKFGFLGAVGIAIFLGAVMNAVPIRAAQKGETP